MRFALVGRLAACTVTPLWAQTNTEGSTDEKAKNYKEALQYLKQRRIDAALDSFKKADKQDDGHCLVCQKKIIKYALELQDWKTAETIDADGVLQDEHIGDASVEGKLKKLVNHTRELQAAEKPGQ